MKNSFSNKIFPVGISIIVICAVIHVFFTIKNYNNILTAVPLWMRVIFVIIFWGILLLLGMGGYYFISKCFKR